MNDSQPHPARRRSAAFFLLASLLLGAASAAAAQPERVIEDFFAAYRQGDVGKMTALYAADAHFTDVAQRHEAAGRTQLQEMLGQLVGMHKVMNVEIKRQAVTGDLVAVEVIYSGTLDCAALGRPDHPDLEYVLPAVLLFEVAKGQIQRQTDYLDFRTFTETFAALQAQGAQP